MSPARAVIEEFLRRDMLARGHGHLYSRSALCAAAHSSGLTAHNHEIIEAALRPTPIMIRYRGGNSIVPITFENPNRSASLQQIDADMFSFDTELAVQRGAAT